MTPKEKAKELVEKLQQFSYCADGVNSMERQYQIEDNAKQCALVAVDEILDFMINNLELDIEHNGNIEFWQEVKQEIINF